jgi:hypothetical protein
MLKGAPVHVAMCVLDKVHKVVAPTEPDLGLQRAAFVGCQDQITLINSSTKITEHKSLIRDALIMATAPSAPNERQIGKGKSLIAEYSRLMNMDPRSVRARVQHRDGASISECHGEYYRIKRKERSDKIDEMVQENAMKFWISLPEVRNMGSGKTVKVMNTHMIQSDPHTL